MHAQREFLQGLSISHLKRLILKAGLEHFDCLEKHDLVQRAEQAQQRKRAKGVRERFGRVDAGEAVRQPVAEQQRDGLGCGERVREEPRALCLADAGALAEHVARRTRQEAATVVPAALRRERRNRHRLQRDGAGAVLQLRVEERRRSRVSGEIARGAEWQ